MTENDYLNIIDAVMAIGAVIALVVLLFYSRRNHK